MWSGSFPVCSRGGGTVHVYQGGGGTINHVVKLQGTEEQQALENDFGFFSSVHGVMKSGCRIEKQREGKENLDCNTHFLPKD